MRLRAEEPGKFIKLVASGFKFIKLVPDTSGLAACSNFDLSVAHWSGFSATEFLLEDPDFLCLFELEFEVFDEEGDDADIFLSRFFVPELCLFELEFEVVEEAADNFRSRFFDPQIPVGGVLSLLMALKKKIVIQVEHSLHTNVDLLLSVSLCVQRLLYICMFVRERAQKKATPDFHYGVEFFLKSHLHYPCWV